MGQQMLHHPSGVRTEDSFQTENGRTSIVFRVPPKTLRELTSTFCQSRNLGNDIDTLSFSNKAEYVMANRSSTVKIYHNRGWHSA